MNHDDATPHSCAGLKLPIAAFSAGVAATLLALTTISILGLGRHDPSYGTTLAWQLSACSAIPLVALHAAGFAIALARTPLVIRRHVGRVTGIAVALAPPCAVLPTWLLGPASLAVIPATTGLIAWCTLRGLLARDVLIARDAEGRCSICGYRVAESASPCCPECGAKEDDPAPPGR